MKEPESSRVELARAMITELHNTVSHIRRISENIGDESELVLAKVYEDHAGRIREKVDAFNSNVARIKAIHQELTKAVNAWYDFTRDDKKIHRLDFPIRLSARRRTISRTIMSLKEEISSLLIKNRLIREDIQKLERDLEFEATQRLKKDVRYEDYTAHLLHKTEILEELRYLLPSLPGQPVKAIDTARLEDALASVPKFA